MVTTRTAPAAGALLVARRGAVLRRVPLPVWIGAGAAVIDYLGAGIPSYWGDEAASVMSAGRSLSSLLQELGAVDAVHGIYYLLLHVWIWAFGSGEWATRALSALGIGLLAAGTVVLGTAWVSRRVGLIAAALIVIIPRASLLAVETRGYALSAAAAVWLIILADRLIRRDADRAAWVRLGVLMGLAAWLFLYLLLVPVALVPMLWASRRTGRRLRHAAAAGVVALLVALPILALAVAQRGQLSFLSHRSYLTQRGVLVTPWFSSVPAAVVLWSLLIGGVLLGVRHRRLRVAIVALVLWSVFPAVALITLSVLVSPTYNPRYLSISLGAVALLGAVGVSGCIDLVRARVRAPARAGVTFGAALVLAVLVLGVTVPQYLHQRTPFAKDGGADFRSVAQEIAQRARPGDAVLFSAGPRPSRAARLAYRLYPEDFRGLADPQLRTSYDRTSGLWDVLATVPDVAGHLQEDTVWLLATHGAAGLDRDRASLTRAGYRLVASDSIHRTTIYEYERGQR